MSARDADFVEDGSPIRPGPPCLDAPMRMGGFTGPIVASRLHRSDGYT